MVDVPAPIPADVPKSTVPGIRPEPHSVEKRNAPASSKALKPGPVDSGKPRIKDSQNSSAANQHGQFDTPRQRLPLIAKLTLWLSALLVVMIALTVTLPFVARSLAMNTMTIAPTSSPTTKIGDTPTVKTTPNDLKPARTLPLLSDTARNAWMADPKQALTDAGTALFGDQWENYLNTINNMTDVGKSDHSLPMHFFHGSLDPSFDWGQAGTMAAKAVESASSESQVLDVVGLAQLNAAINQPDADSYCTTAYSPLGLAAAALVVEDDIRFDTCDAKLSLAYTSELSSADTSLNNHSGHADTDNRLVDAKAACGADPTPAVELVRWRLGDISRNARDPGQYSKILTSTEWQPIVADLEALQQSYPDTPEAQIALGDSYSWLSDNITEYTGTGPFTAREFQNRAISNYESALSSTNSPAIYASLATILMKSQQLEQASVLLMQVSLQETSAEVLRAEALLAAYQHDYAKATQLEARAMNTTTPAAQPALQPKSYLTHGTRLPGLYADVPLGQACGGPSAGSAVESFGFSPQFRNYDSYPSTTRIPEWPDLAFLAGDTNMLEQICNQNSYDNSWAIACQMKDDDVTLSNAVNHASNYQLEYIQNNFRVFGDLDAASNFLISAIKTHISASFLWDRLGEVYFLMGDWQKSVDASSKATYNEPDLIPDDIPCASSTGPGWALLRKAVAERELGDYKNSAVDLRRVLETQLSWDPEDADVIDTNLAPIPYRNVMNMYVAQEQGQIAFAQNDYTGALVDMEASINLRSSADIDMSSWSGGGAQVSSVRGAQEQTASHAACQLGQYDKCIRYAQAAVNADPFSPLYTETLTEAQRANLQNATPTATTSSSTLLPTISQTIQDSSTGTPGGNPSAISDHNATASATTSSMNDSTTPPGDNIAKQEVIDLYKQGLDLDPTLFSSWNNMGVLLAQVGQIDGAVDAFKHAVQARPKYAIGWFNLGVAWHEEGGFVNFIRSQGSLGQAGLLDPSLKQQAPALRFDEIIYDSGIDTSKLIPTSWHLTQSVRSRPTLLTISMVLLLIWSVIRPFGYDQAVGIGVEKGFHRVQRQRRFKAISRFMAWRPHWALTTIASFVALIHLSGSTGAWEISLSMVSCATLLAIHMQAPNVLAIALHNTGTFPVHHVSFVPGSIATLIAAPFGLGFAPPAPQSEKPTSLSPWDRRLTLLVLAAIGLLYAIGSWLTGTPFAHSCATISSVLAVSAFVAVRPLDGAFLKLPKWVQWIITIIVIVFSLLFALKII